MKIKDYYMQYELRKINQENYISKRQTILYIFDYPIQCITNMIIPPTNEENYKHQLLCIWPVFGGIFIFYYLKPFFDHHKIVGFVFGLCMTAMMVYFLVKRPSNEKSPPTYFNYVIIMALIPATFWILLISDQIVSIVSAFSFIFDIPMSLFTCLVLPFFDSWPDLLSFI